MPHKYQVKKILIPGFHIFLHLYSNAAWEGNLLPQNKDIPLVNASQKVVASSWRGLKELQNKSYSLQLTEHGAQETVPEYKLYHVISILMMGKLFNYFLGLNFLNVKQGY